MAAPRTEGPAVVAGLLWMTGASTFYALTYVVVREMSATFSVYELVFFRAFFGVLVMTPWLLRTGVRGLRTRRWKLFGLRAALSYSGMLCWFYALATIPLADAAAILFTGPFFTVIYLQAMIGEHVGRQRWIAIVTGFAGVLLILKPGMAVVATGTIAALYTAFAYGGSNAATRALATTEDSNTVIFYMFALMLPLSLGPAAVNWTTPGIADLPLVLAFAVVAVVSIQCMTRAFASAPAAVVLPAYYLQLPFTAVMAYAFYGEEPDIWTWVGAVVICASGYWIARVETRKR